MTLLVNDGTDFSVAQARTCRAWSPHEIAVALKIAGFARVIYKFRLIDGSPYRDGLDEWIVIGRTKKPSWPSFHDTLFVQRIRRFFSEFGPRLIVESLRNRKTQE
jgi:hypothetical protein